MLKEREGKKKEVAQIRVILSLQQKGICSQPQAAVPALAYIAVRELIFKDVQRLEVKKNVTSELNLNYPAKVFNRYWKRS